MDTYTLKSAYYAPVSFGEAYACHCEESLLSFQITCFKVQVKKFLPLEDSKVCILTQLPHNHNKEQQQVCLL